MSELGSRSTGLPASNSRARMLPRTRFGTTLRILTQFAHYFTPPGAAAPAGRAHSTCCAARVAGRICTHANLSAVTMRRKLAAVRSLFQFLMREGRCANTGQAAAHSRKRPSCCRAFRPPNKPIDTGRPSRRGQVWSGRIPSAICSIFELLYGCGLRSQRTGRAQSGRFRPSRALASRARQGPQRAPGAVSARKPPRRWKAICQRQQSRVGERRCFVNHRGHRADRSRRARIVKFYARMLTGDSSLSIRTACGTLMPRTCSAMAPTCGRSRNCSAMRGCRPRKSTRRFR